MLAFDKLYDDTLRIVCSLDKKNIYFLSARKRVDAALNELIKIGLYDYPEKIYIENPDRAEKNKTERLLEIKNLWDDDVIMIGDTEIDAFAAKNAMVKSVILNRGFRNKAFFTGLGIQSYDNLDQVFLSLNIEKK